MPYCRSHSLEDFTIVHAGLRIHIYFALQRQASIKLYSVLPRVTCNHHKNIRGKSFSPIGPDSRSRKLAPRKINRLYGKRYYSCGRFRSELITLSNSYRRSLQLPSMANVLLMSFLCCLFGLADSSLFRQTAMRSRVSTG